MTNMRGGTQKYAIKPNNQMNSARLRTHNFASRSTVGPSELFLSLSAECQIPEKHIFCFGKKVLLLKYILYDSLSEYLYLVLYKLRLLLSFVPHIFAHFFYYNSLYVNET